MRTHRTNTRTRQVLPAIAASVALSQGAHAASFQGLGFLPGGTDSFGVDISADGSVVVGGASNSLGQQEAFRWSAATGTQGLGILGANPAGTSRSYANAVSADGSVVVGGTSSAAVTSASSSGTEAFRWTQGTGMVGLGLLPGGGSSNGTAVSGDGNTVLGYGSATGYSLQSAVWTGSSGWQGLGDLPGGQNSSYAWAISGDGSTVASLGVNASNQTEGFKWTQGDGVVGLGIPAGNARSEPYGINADGSIIVGTYGTGALDKQAAYWTGSTGWVGIGSMGYRNARASALTDDGSIIVGNVSTLNPLTSTTTVDAFIWDAARGMRSADAVLAAGYGLNLAGWDITEINAITPDGRFLAGTGIGPNGARQAWIADLHPVPVPAAVWLFGSALASLVGWSRFRAARC